MEPIRTTEYALQFAARLSPWWLLPLLPLAVAGALMYYRLHRRDLKRFSLWSLGVLRGLLLAAVLLLLFKPSLVFSEILTFPGRIVLLVDDSASLGVGDPGLPPAAALREARLLGLGQDETDAPFHHIAARLLRIEAEVTGFAARTAELDRQGDAFWEQADTSTERLAESFSAIDEALEKSAGVAVAQTRRDPLRAELVALKRSADALYRGADPGERAFTAVGRRCLDLAERFFALQASIDEPALADPASASSRRARELRDTPRLARLAHLLRLRREELLETWDGQVVQVQRLLTGERQRLQSFDFDNLSPNAGETDLGGRLTMLAREAHDFPLTAVVLLSDGRDLGDTPPEAVVQALTQARAPVFACGIGALREPPDLAVLAVAAPPLAVRERPTTIRVRLKATLPGDEPIRLEIRDGENVLAADEFAAPADSLAVRSLSVRIPETGLKRLTARLASTTGEVLPTENNARDFVVQVRDDPVRVLLLDWRPRWETRFALNVFSRLDYVEVNPLIVLSQEEQTLKRGMGRGAWPRDAEALAIYDLVLVGMLPENILSAQEWRALRDYVENGGALCLLGDGKADPLPEGELRESLLPPATRGDDAKAVETIENVDRLRLGPSGRLHPLTAALQLPASDESGRASRLRPATVPLLLTRDGEVPISLRGMGDGRVILLDTDDLWRVLNPRRLGAHTALYRELITWAVVGGFRAPEKMPLVLDRNTLVAGESLQVWSGRKGALTARTATGEEVAAATLHPLRSGSALFRAVLPRLPAGDLVVSRADGSDRAIVPVVNRDAELSFLARDGDWLARTATETGGAMRAYTSLPHLAARIPPRARVERRETIWRLWDATTVLLLVAGLLTVEWVWRKWVGLV